MEYDMETAVRQGVIGRIKRLTLNPITSYNPKW